MIIKGTAFRDILFGGSGDDFIFGLGGNDQIYGGAGADILSGGPGDDIVDAGANFRGTSGTTDRAYTDELHGGAGRDVLHAPARRGLVDGDSDNDGNTRNDVKYSDLIAAHGHPGATGRATRVDHFDVKGYGSGSKVQDYLKFTSSDEVRLVGIKVAATKVPEMDGDGWSAHLGSFTLAGEFGELVQVEPVGVTVHSDDGSYADLRDFVMGIVEDALL